MDNGFSKACPHGNHMIDIPQHRSGRIVCWKCNGDGEVPADVVELLDYLEYLHDEGYSKAILQAVREDWRLRPYFPCRVCGGDGFFDE